MAEKKEFNLSSKPFIIAEMSGNHNQSIERALEIIDAAAETGVDAVKLQTYTASTITMKGAYTIHDKNSLWDGKELFDLYSQAYTPWEWHKQLFDHAAKKGLMCFSSPFDETAVDFLETLNCPIYKIASFENTHFPLLKRVAKTGKPVIMSTGASTIEEITESVNYLFENGCKNLTILKCTSTYPATPENTNLLTIPYFIEKFPQCSVGLSDHTMGIGVSVAAVALGAKVIEKHFTLRRADGGVDSAFSMEPEEMKQLVAEATSISQALGHVQLQPTAKEENSRLFKRSIFVQAEIKKGEVFTKENLKVIRPSTGLAPKHWESILGKKALTNIAAGSPLTWEHVEKN